MRKFQTVLPFQGQRVNEVEQRVYCEIFEKFKTKGLNEGFAAKYLSSSITTKSRLQKFPARE